MGHGVHQRRHPRESTCMKFPPKIIFLNSQNKAQSCFSDWYTFSLTSYTPAFLWYISFLCIYPSWTFYPDNLTDIWTFPVHFYGVISTRYHSKFPYCSSTFLELQWPLNMTYCYDHQQHLIMNTLEAGRLPFPGLNPPRVCTGSLIFLSFISFLSSCCSLRSQLHPELFLVRDPFCCFICPVCSHSLLNSLYLMLIFEISRWLRW